MIKCPYCKEVLKVEKNNNFNTHYTECKECRHTIRVDYKDNEVERIRYKRRDIRYGIHNKKDYSPISFDKGLLRQLKDISIIFIRTEKDFCGSILRTKRHELETMLNNIAEKLGEEKERIHIYIESEEEILKVRDTF